jgi:hypothetical protein
MRCDASKGRYCEALEARADLDGKRGLLWMPWRSMYHAGKKTALVLRGRKRMHDTLVSFCPFCGGDVSPSQQLWCDDNGAVLGVQP